MCSDWLRGVFAWEYVNMAVMSQCFAICTLIRQAWIWKSFSVENSRSLLYLYPFPHPLKLGKSLHKMLCQFSFSWADILSEKNPYFAKLLFCKTRTDYAYKTLCTRLCDWWEFILISAITRVLHFFSGKLIYKLAIENSFPVFASA